MKPLTSTLRVAAALVAALVFAAGCASPHSASPEGLSSTVAPETTADPLRSESLYPLFGNVREIKRFSPCALPCSGGPVLASIYRFDQMTRLVERLDANEAAGSAALTRWVYQARQPLPHRRVDASGAIVQWKRDRFGNVRQETGWRHTYERSADYIEWRSQSDGGQIRIARFRDARPLRLIVQRDARKVESAFRHRLHPNGMIARQQELRYLNGQRDHEVVRDFEADGREIAETTYWYRRQPESKSIVRYGDYALDSEGNWTRRVVCSMDRLPLNGQPGQFRDCKLEVREISYE